VTVTVTARLSAAAWVLTSHALVPAHFNPSSPLHPLRAQVERAGRRGRQGVGPSAAPPATAAKARARVRARNRHAACGVGRSAPPPRVRVCVFLPTCPPALPACLPDRSVGRSSGRSGRDGDGDGKTSHTLAPAYAPYPFLASFSCAGSTSWTLRAARRWPKRCTTCRSCGRSTSGARSHRRAAARGARRGPRVRL
jgi:hypothetical protein